MVSIGERGYLEAAGHILDTGARVREGVRAIPGLRVLQPLMLAPLRHQAMARRSHYGTGPRVTWTTAVAVTGGTWAPGH